MSHYEHQIEHKRQEKDQYFKSHHSPLEHHDLHKFEGLTYFPVNKDLYFDSIKVHEFPDPKEEMIMQTNTGKQQHYFVFGKVVFPVSGKDVELQIYTNPRIGDDYYFLPFWDETVLSKETYGAGRYLELDKNKDGSFVLDFNIAYNPFCAYNEHYSCPLTPPKNRLRVRIEAGEKDYKP